MRYHMNLYFEAGGTVLALVTLGKYLETKAKRKTSSAIEKLIWHQNRIKVGDEVFKPFIEDIAVGDIILVKPGMSVLLMVLLLRVHHQDQAAIIGESVPVEKL